MPRSGDHARRRLQQAALELFREQGYDETTAAQIAARAGVTERTFFRHFPDKREVFFDGEAPLRAGLSEALDEAPAALGPLAAMLWAFHRLEPLFETNRPDVEPRAAVVAATPALVERQLTKAAALIALLAQRLAARGVEPRLATLAAQAGMAAWNHAVAGWYADPAPGLAAHLDRAFDQLRDLTMPGGIVSR